MRASMVRIHQGPPKLMHTLLLFASLFLDVPAKTVKAPVPKCFVVHSVVPAENDHEYYWASWTNSCHYDVDSVYIMIDFMYKDPITKQSEKVGSATWMLHFITQGRHETTRFSSRPNLPPYTHIRVFKITTDPDEALKY